MLKVIVQWLKGLFKRKQKQNKIETNLTLKQHSEVGLDNEFIRLKRIDAGLRTNKLISLIFSYVDFKHDNANKNGEIIVTIGNNEINNFISSDGVKNHDTQFKEIAREIISTSVVTGRLNGVYVAFPIIDYMQQNEDKTFTFRINNVFKPYVQELKNKYSVLQLETIKKFKSNHGFILYQELMSWYVHTAVGYSWKEQYYTTSQLFDLFNLDKTDYHDKKGKLDRPNFESKVIEKAVNDINNIGEITVQWEKIKEGNTVKCYKFGYGSRREALRNGREKDVWKQYKSE